MWLEGQEEGGRRGRGRGERATDSVEPQNSHKQSLLSGLVRHFHNRKSFDMLPLVQTPNQFFSSAISCVKASVTLEPNVGKLGLSSLMDDASHQCLALVQGKGSDMDLVALKTRLLEKLVPIRRDESECVMTAVPRSCFALAPLFQKSDPAKSEIRKKRNLFFFHISLFSILSPHFSIKTPKRHF